MKKWMFPVFASLTGALISLFVYSQLPDRMVVHFDSSEMADNWVSKPLGAFLLPLLIIGVSALTILSVKFERNENKRRRSEASIGSIAAIVAAIMLGVHLLIIAYNLGYEIGVAASASVIVGIAFILLGNLLPRLEQRTLQWPRLPEEVQRKLYRFQGRMMILFGLAFLLTAALPADYIFPGFFLLIVLFILAVIGSMGYFLKSSSR